MAVLLGLIESIPGSTAWGRARVIELVAEGRDRSVMASLKGQVTVLAFAHGAHDLNLFLYPGSTVILRRLIVVPEYRGA